MPEGQLSPRCYGEGLVGVCGNHAREDKGKESIKEKV